MSFRLPRNTMHIYINVYIYRHVYGHIYIYVYVYGYTYMCVHIYTCISIHISLYMYIHIYKLSSLHEGLGSRHLSEVRSCWASWRILRSWLRLYLCWESHCKTLGPWSPKHQRTPIPAFCTGLCKGGFNVTSGTAEWYVCSSGTDLGNSEIASSAIGSGSPC